jgi:hypothetical protein
LIEWPKGNHNPTQTKTEAEATKEIEAKHGRSIQYGGADGIRTHDLLDAIEARSQLRHGPTVSGIFIVPHPLHPRSNSPQSHRMLTNEY